MGIRKYVARSTGDERTALDPDIIPQTAALSCQCLEVSCCADGARREDDRVVVNAPQPAPMGDEPGNPVVQSSQVTGRQSKHP